jgi:hypothetical protein
MKKQVAEGLYWYSEKDREEGRTVKVWYNDNLIRRGWYCTPLENNKAVGRTYPLSPEILRVLKSEPK